MNVKKLAKRSMAIMMAGAMMATAAPVDASFVAYAAEADALSPVQVVNADAASLLFNDRVVVSKVTLATSGLKGSTITWKSSNDKVLSSKGEVTRPAAGKADEKVTLEATVSKDGVSKKRKFEFTVLAENSIKATKQFSLDEVELLDDYYSVAEKSDVEFLNKFEVDRLMSRFRETAGLDTKGIKPYSGWEDGWLGGHCVGHYLTAAAQGVRATGDEALTKKLETIIDEMKICQDALGTGFVFGAKIETKGDVEKQFDILEGKKTGSTWVPWYNMHKMIQGFVDVYKYTGNETALEVGSKLGDWVYNRVSKWDAALKGRVLGTEYGGMNDCLYELYGFTKKPEHLAAAEKFDETGLFQTVSKGAKNCLNGKHANTTIPKFLGALKRYVILNELGELKDADKAYLTYAEKFFDIAISRHGYVTGGVSVMEHFRSDNKQDSTRTQTNCESCCAHNMLKMAKELYKATGNKKYSDYYETTLRNSIMAAVKEKTAQAAYFIPMATGFYKTFGDADPAKNMFWCCTGSGMENFTKLQESMYFHTDNQLIVAQYVASKITWAEKNVAVTQDSNIEKTDIAKFTIDAVEDKAIEKFDLVLRVPDWIHGNATVKVNGTEVKDAVASAGFITVKKDWVKGDEVTIQYPMGVDVFGLPDNNEVYAFRYGPTLLAAKLGTKKMSTDPSNNYNTWAGANLTAPRYRVVGSKEKSATIGYGDAKAPAPFETEIITIKEDKQNYEYLDNIANYLVKDAKSETLLFKLKGTNDTDNFTGGLSFVPFNKLNDERYGIYWHFQSAYAQSDDSVLLEAKESNRNESNFLDSTQPGYGQYEKDAIHQLTEKDSQEGTIQDGGSTRYAKAGGYFTYNFMADTTKDILIVTQLAKEDNGKTLKVTVGTTEVAKLTLNYTGTDKFYKQEISIPQSVVKANIKTVKGEDGKDYKVIPVTFASADSKDSARLVGSLSVFNAFSTNATLVDFKSATGTVAKDADKYTVTLPEGATEAGLTFKIADEYGLLYINDKLVDDTKEQKFAVGTTEETLKVKVFAEDHKTSKEYTVVLKPTVAAAQVTPAPETPVVSPKPQAQATVKKASIKLKSAKSVKKGKKITIKLTKKNTKAKTTWTVSKKSLVKITKKTQTKLTLQAKKKGKVKVTAKVGKLKKSVTIKIK